ncbi:hypothetical protein R6Q59_009113 [Mikania micrantha]
MADVYQQQQQLSEPRAHQVVKAATAATAGGSLLILSGLTLTATVIALTDPVLVPAAITVFLLAAGFLTSGGFGMAAATVLAWMYRYVSREQPTREEAWDQRTKGRDAGRGHHATGGTRVEVSLMDTKYLKSHIRGRSWTDVYTDAFVFLTWLKGMFAHRCRYGLVVLNLLHGHTGALYMALGISYRPVCAC